MRPTVSMKFLTTLVIQVVKMLKLLRGLQNKINLSQSQTLQNKFEPHVEPGTQI